jgi:hypothetical protein
MPDTGSTAGINVGDAVVSFIADMSQLDKGVDGLTARVESGMAGATDATKEFGTQLEATGETAESAGEEVTEAMDKSRASMAEARGEAALLGEAFGVHLPRHVRTFIAEVPGVGEALQAAFAATAVLFIIDAVVKLTEKVTDFIGTTYIYTQSMKDSEDAIKAFNAELIRHRDTMTGLQKAYDDIGLTADQKLKKSFNDLTDAIGKEDDALEKLKATSLSVATAQGGMWDTVKNGALKAVDFIAGTHFLEDKLTQESADAVKKAEDAKALAVKQSEDKIAEDRLKAAALEKELSLKARKAKEDDMFEYWQGLHNVNQAIEDDTARMVKAVNAQIAEMGKTIAAQGDAPENNPMVKGLLYMQQAAQKLGVVLKSDLIGQLNELNIMYNTLEKSGVAPAEVMKALTKQIDDMQQKIKNFGQEEPRVNAFFQAFEKGGRDSGAAMWGFSDAYGQAIGKVIAGEEGLGAAMESATKQFIGQIGARALVQGMFYLAQGIADTFWNPARAGADFAAAGEFLALGALASGAAAAIPGGSSSAAGGGGSYSGSGTTGITTSGSGAAAGPVTSVHKFAAGGLVSSPTLAMIGDSPSGGSAAEAVLPLDHPETMAKIAAAIAPHLGGPGGASHTFNGTFFGQLKHSDLKRLTKQINTAVNRGTATLKSTSTGRIVKRSA